VSVLPAGGSWSASQRQVEEQMRVSEGRGYDADAVSIVTSMDAISILAKGCRLAMPRELGPPDRVEYRAVLVWCEKHETLAVFVVGW
jgi:hypothetical protein